MLFLRRRNKAFGWMKMIQVSNLIPASIKNKTLRKLAILNFLFFYSYEMESAKPIIKRLGEKGLSYRKANIAYVLKPEDVMSSLGCNKRTAKQYIDLLKILM
jgi:hypothetical protein